ncbi:hypothetical protein Pmani_025883 [Petrolisthes manimaculis]|uniref:Uncharacterized protein n=1 Tax=Petrolisthes manimaculis TaxID=1843537 RepID=A0AAE1TX76_9EUCA|nr:hypothetical protein Pmani_025883 [Petrolisthes manimaculis]
MSPLAGEAGFPDRNSFSQAEEKQRGQESEGKEIGEETQKLGTTSDPYQCTKQSQEAQGRRQAKGEGVAREAMHFEF